MTRRTRIANPFFDAAMLAMEAQQVIALRMMAVAWGGEAAQGEARQMVEEKVAAAATATTMMATATMQGRPDRGAQDVVRMLRRTVRANRKRLSR